MDRWIQSDVVIRHPFMNSFDAAQGCYAVQIRFNESDDFESAESVRNEVSKYLTCGINELNNAVSDALNSQFEAHVIVSIEPHKAAKKWIANMIIELPRQLDYAGETLTNLFEYAVCEKQAFAVSPYQVRANSIDWALFALAVSGVRPDCLDYANINMTK
jgi:hypothetical protein